MGFLRSFGSCTSTFKLIVRYADCLRRHWKTNQVVSVDTHRDFPDPRHHTTRFHRGHLHAALLGHVPLESIHLGKKLLRAEVHENGVSLHFEDGTTAHGDILIGADGLKSVRLYIDIDGKARANAD